MHPPVAEHTGGQGTGLLWWPQRLAPEEPVARVAAAATAALQREHAAGAAVAFLRRLHAGAVAADVGQLPTPPYVPPFTARRRAAGRPPTRRTPAPAWAMNEADAGWPGGRSGLAACERRPPGARMAAQGAAACRRCPQPSWGGRRSTPRTGRCACCRRTRWCPRRARPRLRPPARTASRTSCRAGAAHVARGGVPGT